MRERRHKENTNRRNRQRGKGVDDELGEYALHHTDPENVITKQLKEAVPLLHGDERGLDRIDRNLGRKYQTYEEDMREHVARRKAQHEENIKQLEQRKKNMRQAWTL